MPNISAPTPIPAFASDTESIYVFVLALVFDACVIAPTTELDYDLQIDSQSTFNSINLITLHKNSSAPLFVFIGGNTTVSFAVQMPKRLRGQEQTWYWRARIKKGLFISDYTATQTLTIPAHRAYSIAQEAHTDLADENFYPKEAESTNIFRLLNAGAHSLDTLLLETLRVKEDNFLDSVRDSKIADNFGALYKHPKPITESFGDYRNRIRIFREAYLQLEATQLGIENVIESFVVQPPMLTDNSDIEGWILDTNYIYDPAHPELIPYIILYSRASRGFGFKIAIFNSWGIDYDQDLLEHEVIKIMPRHAKVQFVYETQKPTFYCVNIAADWNTGTFIGTTVIGNGLYVSTPGATGSWISPVVDGHTVNAWDTYDSTQNLKPGDSVTLQLRGSTWSSGLFSAYETVANHAVPVTTPIDEYFQLRVILTPTGSHVPGITDIEFNYERI